MFNSQYNIIRPDRLSKSVTAQPRLISAVWVKVTANEEWGDA